MSRKSLPYYRGLWASNDAEYDSLPSVSRQIDVCEVKSFLRSYCVRNGIKFRKNEETQSPSLKRNFCAKAVTHAKMRFGASGLRAWAESPSLSPAAQKVLTRYVGI